MMMPSRYKRDNNLGGGFSSATMTSVFTHEFDTPTYKGRTQFKTGLFINGEFVDGSNNTYIEYVQSLL